MRAGGVLRIDEANGPAGLHQNICRQEIAIAPARGRRGLGEPLVQCRQNQFRERHFFRRLPSGECHDLLTPHLPFRCARHFTRGLLRAREGLAHLGEGGAERGRWQLRRVRGLF